MPPGAGRAAGGRGASPGPSPAPASPVALQMLDEAFELAKALAKNNPGWVFIPPFDDPLIWYVEPSVPWCGQHPPPPPQGGHLSQGTPSHCYTQQWHTCVCTRHHTEAHAPLLQCPFSTAVSEHVHSGAQVSAIRRPQKRIPR